MVPTLRKGQFDGCLYFYFHSLITAIKICPHTTFNEFQRPHPHSISRGTLYMIIPSISSTHHHHHHSFSFLFYIFTFRLTGCWLAEWLNDWLTGTGRLTLWQADCCWYGKLAKEAMEGNKNRVENMYVCGSKHRFVYELSICIEGTLNWSVLKADVLFIFWTLKAFHSSL